MAVLNVSLVGKDHVGYQGEALAVILPTTTGVIEVLPGHIQLVSALATGEVIIKKKEGDQNFKITGGVLEVRPENMVVILADIPKE